ncbi:MAG TPA: glycosyltransferase, partial [Azospirillum sp.]
APVPVHRVWEPAVGLSRARNAGVAAARGGIVAFTDDDVSVDPAWPAAVAAAFRRYPEAVAIGGRIVPAWEGPVPAWLGRDLHRHLALLDLGDEPRRLAHADVWGANLALRRTLFAAGAAFDPDRGRCGGKLYDGEESRLLQDLIDGGAVVLYCPELVVHHRIGPERLRKAYFRRHQFDRGENEGRLDAGRAFRRVFGVPWWALNLAGRAVGGVALALARRSDRRLDAEMEAAYRLGYLRGSLTGWRARRRTAGGGIDGAGGRA